MNQKWRFIGNCQERLGFHSKSNLIVRLGWKAKNTRPRTRHIQWRTGVNWDVSTENENLEQARNTSQNILPAQETKGKDLMWLKPRHEDIKWHFLCGMPDHPEGWGTTQGTAGISQTGKKLKHGGLVPLLNTFHSSAPLFRPYCQGMSQTWSEQDRNSYNKSHNFMLLFPYPIPKQLLWVFPSHFPLPLLLVTPKKTQDKHPISWSLEWWEFFPFSKDEL